MVDLLDVITLHVDAPDVRHSIKGQDAIDEPDLIILDERGAGLAIFQELFAEGYRHLYRGGAQAGTNEGKHLRFSRPSIAFYDGRARDGCSPDG